MALIPGGTFHMGSDAGYAPEKNGGEVTVATFCMDETEVTVAAYARCVAEGKCTADRLRGAAPSRTEDCNHGVAGREQHPINCVDWHQASAFCAAQGKRLPTEAEWEYAARGGDEGRLYPWRRGEDAGLCWNRQGTCVVGSHPKSDSRWGLHDMAGNVWEWTASAFCDYPPPGKRCRSSRVIRGGGWNTSDWSLVRGANRGAGQPTQRGSALGFRCAYSQ